MKTQIDAEEPFRTKIRPRWMPREMREAPVLDHNAPTGQAQPRTALLINPFYPKDAHASFGKHVLTPTLALTSFAGATPESWSVEYWDENLLHGRPPAEPLPEVVGISVHLTSNALLSWLGGTAHEEARWCLEDCTSSPARRNVRPMRMRWPWETACNSGPASSRMWSGGRCNGGIM